MFEFRLLKPYADRLDYGITMTPFDMEGAVMADQIHTDVILEVSQKPDKEPQCDAFITDEKGLTIMVKVADCQGVLIYDPKNHKAAAVHSGWRGSTMNILGKTVRAMSENDRSNTTDLLAAISPSLGPCCAEFSDPENELPDFCQEFVNGKRYVDFWNISKKQLTDAGVPKGQIELAGVCTKCSPGYFSHRNGDSERMGVFVTLK